MPDVIVIGGGCAGLAAATALAEAGAVVEVLEARASAGGRSYSFVDPAIGDVEDNGQHLVLGCYDEFLRFLRRTGGIAGMEFQRRLEVVLLEPGGGVARFRPGPLPPPFDLLWGLARLAGFPWGDVLRLGRAARAIRTGADPAEKRTVREWLVEHGQSERAQRVFWNPLALATLNLDPAVAPARLLVEVLKRALLGGREASRIGFPRRGLGAVVVEPAARYLRERKATLLCRHPVAALELAGGRFVAARLKDGSRRPAAGAVLAVPHREAAEILPREALALDPREAVRLGGSAIVAIHVWFDRATSDHALAGLLDSSIHWVFDRARVGVARPPGYLALVSSAATDLARIDREELIRTGVAEVRRFLPRSRDARVLRARVVKERWATPDLRPGDEKRRPGTSTRVPNLFLAGDWIDTGLPATLEGAAASGHRAACLLASPR